MAISSDMYREDHQRHENEYQTDSPMIELAKANVINNLSTWDKFSLKKMLRIGLMSDIATTTKQDLFDQRIRLSQLLEFGLSITDIAALWDIRTMEDLANLEFVPDDLKLKGFYSSFSRSQYNITYDMIVAKYHVDLYFFASEEFTVGDLINYDFPMFPLLEGELKIKMSKELFMKFNVRYQEWKTHFGLTRDRFVALGITNLDAMTMGWEQESVQDVIISKRLEVEKNGKKVMLTYWNVKDYPDLDYEATENEQEQKSKTEDQTKKASVPKTPVPTKPRPLSFGDVLNKKFAKK